MIKQFIFILIYLNNFLNGYAQMGKIDSKILFHIINKEKYENKYLQIEEKVISKNYAFISEIIEQMLDDLNQTPINNKILENEFSLYYKHLGENHDLYLDFFGEEIKKELMEMLQYLKENQFDSFDAKGFLIDVFFWSSLEFFEDSWHAYPKLRFTKDFIDYLCKKCSYFKLIIDDLDYLKKFDIFFSEDDGFLNWHLLTKNDAKVLLETFIVDDDLNEIFEKDIQIEYYKRMLEMSINGEVIILFCYVY